MDPNTATTAPSATPAAPAASPAPPTDDYGFPTADDRDGNTMSDTEMEAFVDKTLGIKPKGATPSEPVIPTPTPPAPDESNTTPTPNPTPTAPVGDDQAATPPRETPAAPPVPPPTEATPEETPAALDTSDLWIEVPNSDGKQVKLTLDGGIPEDFMFKDDKQLFEVLEAFNEMKQLRADREATIEDEQTKRAAAITENERQQSVMDGWTQEIQELVDAAYIPAAKAQPANGTAYTQAEIAADPGLKLTSEVFTFMKDENAKRLAAGKSPLQSFGTAFSLYQKQSTAAADEAKAKADAALAKKRGAIVGGSSAPAGGGKGYVYKRGSAKNIWQVPVDDI